MVYIALPVLNESANLPAFLKCMERQDYRNFKTVVCVNNYDHWWDDPRKKEWCLDNLKSIEYLKRAGNNDIILIDRASKGKGWPGKKGGVGWARKTVMDHIAGIAGPDDIIVSMDADTEYPENYLSAILRQMTASPHDAGLAVPYYHKLDGTVSDRLILRYEIYMRYYLINMIRIGNPYAFTAIGSAMAVRAGAYKKTGGLTPVAGGEDFYFIQKLAKAGKVGLWAGTTAYPSSRFSDRVAFGTGPALIKGHKGDWNSYPVYEFSSFDRVKETFDLFPQLYEKDVETPMDGFLRSVFKTEDLWGKIRENYKDRDNFVRACKTKVDALRILQFLRMTREKTNRTDETVLVEFLRLFYEGEMGDRIALLLSHLDFTRQPVDDLNEIRDFLFDLENEMRKGFVSGV